MSSRQLALDFPHEPRFAGADFLPAASNAEARAWLARRETWPQGRLALWGAPGCGKTHLLHVWTARVGAARLAGPGLRFGGAFPRTPLAIDDAELAPERDLLHLLNAAAEAGQPMLLAARTPPARWPVRLPDLTSRLRAITAVEIHPAEEALLRTLLARLLADRHCVVPEAVQDWLLLRLPRTQAAMREAAARLDRAALAAGRPVSRALAATVLDEIGPDEFAAAPPAGEETVQPGPPLPILMP
jgi:chromosomal replication initiation ATPase DnaA